MIYLSKQIDKACFQHDMVHGYFQDLTRRTTSDKILCDKAFNIAKIQNMMDIKGVFLEWFINFLIIKTSGSGIKNENMLDKQLAEELYKTIIR